MRAWPIISARTRNSSLLYKRTRIYHTTSCGRCRARPTDRYMTDSSTLFELVIGENITIGYNSFLP